MEHYVDLKIWIFKDFLMRWEEGFDFILLSYS
jgi:hypothetical protein